MQADVPFLQRLAPCVVGYLITRYPNRFSKAVSAVALVAIIIPIVGNNVSMLQMLHVLGIYDTMIGNWIMSSELYLHLYVCFRRGVQRRGAQLYGSSRNRRGK